MAEASRDLGQQGVGTTDPEDSPNMIVYRKIEDVIMRIQDEKAGGVAIRTVKSFLSKIPSVVSGAEIVLWLVKNLSIEDSAEAIHLGSLIAAQGYLFPISDHVLTLKDDGTLYRFQAPYFWPSNCWEPENTDYAIYLCKRTMQNKARLELADYEAENLARLQRAFARKWEFIFMQAEAQVKIDRKKDKVERKILDSQERAFWDVHRPVPGCVNTTEMDIRKCRREKNPQRVKKVKGIRLLVSVYGVTDDTQTQSPVHQSLPSQPVRKPTREDVQKEISFLNIQLDRHCMKMSKVADSLMGYTEQFMVYDPLASTVEPSNPWISDDMTFWDLEASRDPSQHRVKKWGFSLEEALKDPAGQEAFLKFLESEFSSENLRFWLAVQDLKRRPLENVATRAQEIWQEFLAEGAPSSINLDSHSYERTSHNLQDPGRYSYEDAQEHIFKLMKSDSYARFLRSNIYQDLLLARKKPDDQHHSRSKHHLLLSQTESEQGRRTSLEKFTRSVGKSLTGKRLTGLMQSS
ncbi:regulator of G-protein signaling 6-like isoform X1 [Oncorhynchus keta]|uniref:regulator of G-protein signaling 6-like isoform X1 n=1 Tax=Oncorhynchus keta TaxID=8018 RepID=UPI00227BA323|nr:regulator of G-protein signaling 6-like isoform X1 [Oncorhynchus keta]XP_052352828.1 regulator of G-protein signaling 6-like isoform X1 [Oncorhynchus keta]